MQMILAHTGHHHGGPDLSLVALLAVGLVLGAWAVVSALRAWRYHSGPADGRTPAASPDPPDQP